MIAFTPHMKLHGARMKDAGFSIIPIAPGQKYPAEYVGGVWKHMPGWSRWAHMMPPDVIVNMWENMPGAGVGIVTGGSSGVIGIDIDVLDEEISRRAKYVIIKHLGETPLIRVGRAPKCMLAYRVEKPMNKISMAPLEVLATGQQFVAYGTHPETGKDYTWPVQAPDDTPVSSLPVVTEAEVRSAIEEAYAEIPGEMRAKKLNDTTQIRTNTNHETAEATIEAITEALKWIPNDDLQWDDWNKILMATFASSRGSELAYFEFLKWSRLSTKHNDATTRAKWTGCRASPPKNLGFGTLHFLAKASGWAPTADLKFNVDKKVDDVDVSGFDKMETVISSPIISGTVVIPEEFKAKPVEAVKLAEPEEHGKGLFYFEEPKKLQLTQEEIHGNTLTQAFIDEFPQEWLYTDSLIGRIAEWLEASSQHPHRTHCLMAAFTLFSALVGRQYNCVLGDYRPNISVCAIAPTGSGKEGPRDAIARLLEAADLKNLISGRNGFTSSAAIIETLTHGPCRLFLADEFGKKIVGYGTKSDASQREHLGMLLEAATNDYVDSKDYANSKERKTKRVVLPNLSIYGTSQLQELIDALSSSARTDGFIQRFLYVPSFANYIPARSRFRKPAPPETIVDGLKSITKMLEELGGLKMASNADATVRPNIIQVALTDEAEDYYEKLDAGFLELTKAGSTMWVRSSAFALKISMLEAIALNPAKPVIDVDLLSSSSKLVSWFIKYCDAYIDRSIADNPYERDLKKIKKMIQDAGVKGIDNSDLARRNHGIKIMDRKNIIYSLLESREISKTEAPSGTRVRITYFIQK